MGKKKLWKSTRLGKCEECTISIRRGDEYYNRLSGGKSSRGGIKKTKNYHWKCWQKKLM